MRVDILRKLGDAWELIEVKSSTQARDEHVLDAAIQKWVLEGCGMKVARVFVMHINNRCVHPELATLFTLEDVSTQVSAQVANLGGNVAGFKKMLSAPSAPALDIGPHCGEPYECAFKEHCWGVRGIPVPSVFDLPGVKDRKAWEFYREGLISLDQLQGRKLTAAQQRMVSCTVSGRRYVDRAPISAELASWAFPLYYLDFETMAWAIPRYPGTRPYQQIPFQFSCHVQGQPGGALLHFEYLHDADSDPREALTRSLLQALGTQGSIVAYNKAFEGTRLKELAREFPKLGAELEALIDRLVDPLQIFRAHVYDPGFGGSFSIKAVAPALLGEELSYEGMPVADGTGAQLAYLEMIAAGTSAERKAALRRDLLAYCAKDTLAMVGLVEWLRTTASGAPGE